MRLRARLALFVGLSSLAPMAFQGFATAEVATGRLRRSLEDQQGNTAENLAFALETWIDLQVRLQAQQALTFPIAQLSERAIIGFERLVFSQTPEARMVCLVDLQGRPIVPPVKTPPGPQQSGRPSASEADLQVFLARLPIAELANLQVTNSAGVGPLIGHPYRSGQPAIAYLPILTPIPRSSYSMGLELSLDAVQARLSARAGADSQVVLLDRNAHAFAGPSEQLPDPSLLRPLTGLTGVATFQAPNGRVLGAFAPVAQTGWTVLLLRPDTPVNDAVRDIAYRMVWFALVAAAASVIVGIWVGRELARPIVNLAGAARAVGEGRLGTQVQPEGPQELVELAQVFNEMSNTLQGDAERIRYQQEALQRSSQHIQAQNEEIEKFNLELQERVEARTKALEEAQRRLLKAARLAAAGELGAGIAHELNNPLGGVLGLAQVLRARLQHTPEANFVGSLEEQARRCKEIAARLLRFTEDSSDARFSEEPAADFGESLQDSLRLVGPLLSSRGIEWTCEAPVGLMISIPRREFVELMTQMLMALRTAAPAGGRLDIRLLRDTPGICLELALKGPEIRTAGDDWKAGGLGRWAAENTLVTRGGSLEFAPHAGGANWILHLPVG
jgi:two-component system NtrC family sensor kinase